jgi:hypothetical protein
MTERAIASGRSPRSASTTAPTLVDARDSEPARPATPRIADKRLSTEHHLLASMLDVDPQRGPQLARQRVETTNNEPD